jgi:hypothetical protein
MSQGFCAVCTPSGPESVKLAELRPKTDQQLLRLVHSKLELGLSVVALVEDLPRTTGMMFFPIEYCEAPGIELEVPCLAV